MIAVIFYALLSAALVGIYRWLALRYRWLDTPNQRSSHASITPRGAGLIFALLILGAAVWLLRSHSAFMWSFMAGLIVAFTGWWDDIRGASARARFAWYALSSLAAVILILNYRTAIVSDGVAFVLPWLLGLIATFGLVWLINLYNFMDGINGLAAIEAIFVLLATGIFAHDDSVYAQTFMHIHWWSAAALAGFFVWNFPLGKVFMGDAGSAFLGFLLGILLLWSSLLDGPSMYVWLILLGIFICDSGYTLIARMITRQQWHTAHRLHAYQRLTDRLDSHTHTVAILMIINLCWILPVAWLVHRKILDASWGLGLTYLPLLLGCRWLKAGIPMPVKV